MLELGQLVVVRGRTRTQVLALALLLVPLGVAASVSDVRAQEVPRVKPQYTRLFGADSLNIQSAAISPDGRWIVFGHFESRRENLWLASTEGGEAVRLTHGSYGDYDPRWFPTGDRVAFQSTRPAGPEQDRDYIMTISIDPITGEAVGPPRQITLDANIDRYALSPDGRWIVYSLMDLDSEGRRAVKILPANGGSPRTVFSRRWVGVLAFSQSGDSIYFGARREEGGGNIMRVSVDGGELEVVSALEQGGVRFSPDARRFAHSIEETGEERIIEVATVDGQRLAHLAVPERMELLGYSPDGGLLMAMVEVVAPLRVRPVGGGPPHQLTEPQAYDFPIAWTPDGRQIFFVTELNGHDVYMLAPLDGSAIRQVPLPGHRPGDHGPVLSGTGRHVLFGSVEEGRQTATLKIIDLEDGSSREISRSAWGEFFKFNVAVDGEHFLYCDLRDDRYEFRTVHPEGSPRTLWSFSADEDPPAVGVRGDRIVFTRVSGDSWTLYVGRAGDEEAVPVLTLAGEMNSHTNEAIWSPDGKRIAVAYRPPGREEMDVAVVDVAPSGELTGEPRILELAGGPKWWWDTQWLPDGSGFTILGMGAEGMWDTDVWLVSLDPETPPFPMTREEPGSIWGYVLSPDGRYIAYPTEVPRGSSLWLIDLGEVLQGAGN